MRGDVLKHVEKTLAVLNRRPSQEITDALLSWDRAKEHLFNLEKILGSVKKKTLLEIGSGYGLFLTLSLLKGAETVGIEPAENRSYTPTLEISKKILKRAGFSTNLVRPAFGEKLPFADNSFDLVASFYTLEHVRNVEKVIKEAVRVLKPGGNLFFEIPNYGSFWEGHYGILWIPYLPKSIARYYVRLWGKEGGLLDELQLVNSFILKKAVKDLPIDIVDMGKKSFKEKVSNLKPNPIGTLGSAYAIIDFFKKFGILEPLTFFANLINAQTPIIFVARKHDKI